jgi:dienelactone hydrolase
MTPDVVEFLRDGRFAELHELFTPQLRSLVTPEVLQSGWATVVAQHGEFVTAGPAVTEQGMTRIPLEFANGRLTLVIASGPNGLGGLQFASAEPIAPWEPPSYVDSSRFEEVPLDEVSGTLSLPHGSGPWPAVVLLSGSGSHDRDETIGRNKPLKDVAWGLASRGIAVLRLDKRPRQVATVYDEYAPAALAAVRLLGQRNDIGRVYLLGHSLGGTVAPRIAVSVDIAGLILFAGGAQPLHRAMLRQFRHIGAPDASIEAVARQADLVDSPDLSDATPTAELPFGVPASYWLDLRAYDAPATAAALEIPILICQGARDYQVTVADDLALWQEKLAGRDNVTVRVYEADNHLFFPGSGPSTPAEYEPAQHVDPAVIADLAEWLTSPGH